MNGPVERVPIRMNSGCTSDSSRAMSLLHKASRQWRSSSSIVWHSVSATQSLSCFPLRPNADKANLRVVALHGQTRTAERKQLVVENRLAHVVLVEPEQQVVSRRRIDLE